MLQVVCVGMCMYVCVFGKRTSLREVLAMEAARHRIVKKTHGGRQLKWPLLMEQGRVPAVHPTTAKRAFEREGLDVKLRRSREKPQRTPEVEQERKELCDKLRRWPADRFVDGIDLIIDNKRFDVPTSADARAYMEKQAIVAQLRTRAEGLQDGFTKPNNKRHRKNMGGTVNVCAGIANGRIVLWEYLPKWGGQAAVDLYKGPIMSKLRQKRGEKASYLIAEDNDPTGYKSAVAVAEKRRLKIRTLQWPRYSPDLMPLDFCLWDNISKRTLATAPAGRESINEFKARLRQVALRTPPATVRSAVLAMKSRAQKIWERDGKDIARD